MIALQKNNKNQNLIIKIISKLLIKYLLTFLKTGEKIN